MIAHVAQIPVPGGGTYYVDAHVEAFSLSEEAVPEFELTQESYTPKTAYGREKRRALLDVAAGEHVRSIAARRAARDKSVPRTAGTRAAGTEDAAPPVSAA